MTYAANGNGQAPAFPGSDPERAPQAPPALPEQPTAAKEREKIKIGATQERADIPLKALRERTEKREYDTETLRLIGEVTMEKPLDQQEKPVSVLSDVSLLMMATILYSNPALPRTIDITNFDN